jgi:hypothetical protein
MQTQIKTKQTKKHRHSVRRVGFLGMRICSRWPIPIQIHVSYMHIHDANAQYAVCKMQYAGMMHDDHDAAAAAAACTRHETENSALLKKKQQSS